jgi:hypothetical protein
MQEEKSRTNVTPTKEDAERDATSKETVSDLKESGNASADSKTNSDSGNSTTPSPDGQFDSPRDGAGPGDETGPM